MTGPRGGEDSVGRRVHPEKRSVSWVNSVLRQFLPHGPTARRSQRKELTVISTYAKSFSRYDWDLAWNPKQDTSLQISSSVPNPPVSWVRIWKGGLSWDARYYPPSR